MGHKIAINARLFYMGREGDKCSIECDKVMVDEPQSGGNSCLWLFYSLLDDWGGNHWLPQIGPRVPLAMVSVLLTWSGWRNIQ